APATAVVSAADRFRPVTHRAGTRRAGQSFAAAARPNSHGPHRLPSRTPTQPTVTSAPVRSHHTFPRVHSFHNTIATEAPAANSHGDQPVRRDVAQPVATTDRPVMTPTAASSHSSGMRVSGSWAVRAPGGRGWGCCHGRPGTL